MGGRSRQYSDSLSLRLGDPREKYPWVSQLSDVRLHNYGEYSLISYREASDFGAMTQTGKPKSPELLNAALVEEYIERHNTMPAWSLKEHQDSETVRRRNLGLNTGENPD
ncbi:hypothetical protein [Methylomonas rhizoryzae]|uniref:hypothetical protein n=1 Tax=Methylomonas rhizoryzae TaxID=2608981 RepID=UPI001231D5AB|nr:hypothetical protein [Methylomonas rhizoryzae]